MTIIAQISAMQKGVNPGSWRYILHIVPLIAVFANIGFVNVLQKKFFKFNASVFGIYLIMILTLWSKSTNGLDLTEESSYLNLLFSLLMLIIYLFFNSSKNYQKYIPQFSLFIIVINIIFLVVFFTPRKLSDANIVMKEVVEYISKSDLRNNIIYTTHSNFDFYQDHKWVFNSRKSEALIWIR